MQFWSTYREFVDSMVLYWRDNNNIIFEPCLNIGKKGYRIISVGSNLGVVFTVEIEAHIIRLLWIFIFLKFWNRWESPLQRKTPYRKGRGTRGRQTHVNQSPKVYQEGFLEFWSTSRQFEDNLLNSWSCMGRTTIYIIFEPCLVTDHDGYRAPMNQHPPMHQRGWMVHW
jgi:hypothetical protein